MTIIHRRIDNDVRSPSYLCEIEDIAAVRPAKVPVWIIVVLLLTLLAVGRIEDVAALAYWLDQVIDQHSSR